MAVTSRSWPDEIPHLTRKREQERRDADERREREKRQEKEKEVCGKKREGGRVRKVQKKKSTMRWRRRRAADVSRVH